MKLATSLFAFLFSLTCNADVMTKALTDSSLKDIQKGIAELSLETDRGSAKIYAEALSKRIDREAYLAAQQASEMQQMLQSLMEELNKQRKIIKKYEMLVAAMENRIKELENE